MKPDARKEADVMNEADERKWNKNARKRQRRAKKEGRS